MAAKFLINPRSLRRMSNGDGSHTERVSPLAIRHDSFGMADPERGSWSQRDAPLPSYSAHIASMSATLDSFIRMNLAGFGDAGATARSAGPVAQAGSLGLGNLVFFDANHDGLFNAGDTGIDGVTVTLFADTNANGVYDAGTDTQIGSPVTTAGGGVYSFASLAPGDYIVRIDASNFTSGGALVGRVVAAGGGDPDNDIDNDSNGIDGAGGIVVS